MKRPSQQGQKSRRIRPLATSYVYINAVAKIPSLTSPAHVKLTRKTNMSSLPQVHDTPSTTPLEMSAGATPNPENVPGSRILPPADIDHDTDAMEIDSAEPTTGPQSGNSPSIGNVANDENIQMAAQKGAPNSTEDIDEDQPDDDETALSLPISKIKKIFKMDPDYVSASSGALYATGLATELFVQYLVEQASVNARMEKRKKLQYKDFSHAVSAQESLHFLSDTVPKAQPIGELIQQKKINVSTDQPDILGDDSNGTEVAPTNTTAPAPLPKGQQTLPFGAPNPEPVKKAVLHDLMADD